MTPEHWDFLLKAVSVSILPFSVWVVMQIISLREFKATILVNIITLQKDILELNDSVKKLTRCINKLTIDQTRLQTSMELDNQEPEST